jgi:beta-xylosidase
MITSRDLVHWERAGHVLEQHPDEKSGFFWAPEVATDGKRFYLYYSPGGRRPGLQFHIRCAASDRPEGPYRDVGTPLTELAKNPFAIDAHAFRDDDGQWYMFYATDFLDFSDHYHRGTALVVDRMASMTTLEGNPKVVKRATRPWQLFQRQRDMYGTVADWYTLEGPTVIKRHGTYYLFYSGGCFENDTYGVDVLTAPHPLGPWTEPTPALTKLGPQVVRTIPGKVIGPGHNSIVTAPDGTDYFVYHAWNKEMTERQLWLDPLTWTPATATLPPLPRIARFAHHIEQMDRAKV